MTADARRAFVHEPQGDGTLSVINAQTNALDTFYQPDDERGDEHDSCGHGAHLGGLCAAADGD